MANVYRRKKNGKFIGSYFIDVDGVPLNLHTKDAAEARRRAGLAARGKWPPVDAAAEAAIEAMDPAGSDDSAAAAPAAVVVGSVADAPIEAAPEAVSPTPSAQPQPAVSPAEAASAAAAEMAGERAEAAGVAVAVDQQAAVDAKLAAVMAKVAGGSGGDDVLGTACSMVAGLLLGAERKAIEWGVSGPLKKSNRAFVPGEPTEIALEALAAGLQGYAVQLWPDFASKLTPGWAVVLGLAVGGGAMVTTGKVVELAPKNGVPAAAPPAPVPGQSQAAAPA
jgi:hypothetical protein